MKRLAFLLLVSCSAPPDPVPVVPLEVSIKLLEVNNERAKIIVSVDGDYKNIGVFYGLTPNTEIRSDGDTATLLLQENCRYYVKGYARSNEIYYSPVMQFYSVCPTDIGGTINYVTVLTSGGCDPNTSGVTTFTKITESAYAIGDASFGVYACEYSDSPSYGILLNNVCDRIFLTGDDQYGFTYSWEILSNNGTDLVVGWENSYGDKGYSKLTRAGGWPELWQ